MAGSKPERFSRQAKLLHFVITPFVAQATSSVSKCQPYVDIETRR